MSGEPAARMRPGLTLVEAAVALVILSMTVLAGMESTARALRAQHDADRHREAATIAEWQLGRLAAATPDSLRRYTAGERGEITLDGVRYRWRAVARPGRDSPRLWDAAVEVEWDDGRMVLETRLYRRSPLTFAGP